MGLRRGRTGGSGWHQKQLCATALEASRDPGTPNICHASHRGTDGGVSQRAKALIRPSIDADAAGSARAEPDNTRLAVVVRLSEHTTVLAEVDPGCRSRIAHPGETRPVARARDVVVHDRRVVVCPVVGVAHQNGAASCGLRWRRPACSEERRGETGQPGAQHPSPARRSRVLLENSIAVDIRHEALPFGQLAQCIRRTPSSTNGGYVKRRCCGRDHHTHAVRNNAQAQKAVASPCLRVAEAIGEY